MRSVVVYWLLGRGNRYHEGWTSSFRCVRAPVKKGIQQITHSTYSIESSSMSTSFRFVSISDPTSNIDEFNTPNRMIFFGGVRWFEMIHFELSYHGWQCYSASLEYMISV